MNHPVLKAQNKLHLKTIKSKNQTNITIINTFNVTEHNLTFLVKYDIDVKNDLRGSPS